MVEIDARDDGDQGRKNVGGIEAAAESDFEHSKLNAVAGEGFKCHGGNTFEIGGMRAQFAGGKQFFDQRLNTRKGFCKRCIADFLAVNADALVDFFEVWRSIQASAQTSVAKDGFEERSGRTLAVGACDMGTWIGAVRAAEALGEGGDIFKIELCGGSLRRRGQFAAKGKQIADRGLVIHVRSRASRGSWR